MSLPPFVRNVPTPDGAPILDVSEILQILAFAILPGIVTGRNSGKAVTPNGWCVAYVLSENDTLLARVIDPDGTVEGEFAVKNFLDTMGQISGTVMNAIVKSEEKKKKESDPNLN